MTNQQQQKQELEVSKEEQQILDSIAEQLMDQQKVNEQIKSGIIRRGALDLLKARPKKKQDIAKMLVNKLTREKKLVSRDLIYYVLKDPVFKPLKGPARGRDRKLCSTTQLLNSVVTCEQILRQEVEKIRTEWAELSKGHLSNKDIRERIFNLDSLKKFTPGTVKKYCEKVLPLRQRVVPTLAAKIPAGMTQYDMDKRALETDLIRRTEQLQAVAEWLSGMEEWERREFEKSLPKGKAYSLALQDQCRDHIWKLTKMMPTSFIGGFLSYCDELAHLVKVFDEKLWEEKLSRERSRSVAST